MGVRNKIIVVGETMRQGVTWLSDELVRFGAHDDALGSDGFVVMVYLLSCASVAGDPNPWETSARAMSQQFGWGMNRKRVSKALERAVKDHRLLIREYLHDGTLMGRKRDFVVCAGGRRFTDVELLEYSRPKDWSPQSGTHGGAKTSSPAAEC